MDIRTVTFDRLTNEEIAAWSSIQRSEPALFSPFFRPEFTQAVAAVRNNVEVAILEANGQPVGFFPFERKRWNRGMPVGTRLSDYQGVIAPAHVDYDPIELVRRCGLSSWCFDHLVDPQSSFAKFTFRVGDSQYVDLSNGFETHQSTLSAGFRSRMRSSGRRLQREIGPIRFEQDVRDPVIFSTLLEWKIAQYKRTKVLNVLRFPWVRQLLERICEFHDPDFSAVMPVLYAGDNVVAVALLLRSGNVMHSWFSSYDRELGRYSPGMLLKMEVLRSAAASGTTRYDLGKGFADYKQILQSGAVTLAEGAVDLSMFSTRARSAWWAVRGGIRSTRLHKLIQRPARTMYQLRCWMDLQ